jgi:PKD repeat protein
MQKKPGTEHALSEAVSITLILLLVVVIALVIYIVVIGHANLAPKSAYIAMRGVGVNLSIGAGSFANTISLFHFEGDAVNLNRSRGGNGVAPVSFNLRMPSGDTENVLASSLITDNTWNSGDTITIYEDASGYWVTDNITPRIAKTGTLGPLVDMPGGNYTVNVIDKKADVLIAAVPVNITGPGTTGPQYSPGLIATYYTDQVWTTLAATNIAQRVYFADAASGRTSDVSGWPSGYIGRAENFSVKFDGFFKADTEADYTFTLSSDDGSYMDLAGTSNFISNGGLHSYASVSATKHLKPGYYPITIRMYENTGAAVVYLTYTTPATPSSQVVTQLYHIPSTAPTPDFSGFPRAGPAPLTVRFTDKSIDAKYYAWDFGDGLSGSHDKNPQHTYTTTGKYDVTLVATNSFGSKTAKKTGYVTVGSFTPGLLASYYRGQSWSELAGTRIDSSIDFTDQSSTWPVSMVGRQENFSVTWDGYILIPADGDYSFSLTSDDGSWLWLDDTQLINNGGDHSSATVTQTASLTAGYHHIVVGMYENGGIAVARLTTSPAVTYWHIPSTPPVADFSATSRTGPVPLTVQFTDASTDATSWSWNFGDGTPVSTDQNPSHTYSSSGTYDVSLVASNAFGTSTATKTRYITAGTLIPGLNAYYYTDQTWTSLKTSNSANQIHFADTASGRASDVSNWPSAYTGGLVEHFSVKYDGLIRIDTADDYTFTLSSDDGSYMDLDGTTNFISNGGDHSYASVSATRHLVPGYYPVTVRMYENTGAAVVYLEYKTPSMASSQLVTSVWHI